VTPPDATATPMRALILQHEEPTPPGLVTEWLGGHGASVETETPNPPEAYADYPRQEPSAYRDGDLPDL